STRRSRSRRCTITRPFASSAWAVPAAQRCWHRRALRPFPTMSRSARCAGKRLSISCLRGTFSPADRRADRRPWRDLNGRPLSGGPDAHVNKRCPMSIHLQRAAGPALAIALLTPPALSPALAHEIVGNRFFPATLGIDDPGVNDELSLPTVDAFKT